MEFYPLARGVSLIEVTCLMGAYQGTYRYYIYDETRIPAEAEALEFEVGNPDKLLEGRFAPEKSMELIGTPAFDSKKKELSILTKTRGVGDCGSYTVYPIL